MSLREALRGALGEPLWYSVAWAFRIIVTLFLQEIIPAGFEDLEGVVSFEMDIKGVDSGDVMGGGQEAPPTTEEGEEMETNTQYEIHSFWSLEGVV